MGWLVGKHFFSHNNLIFFFFSLSVFPLVSGCTLYPYSRFYSSPNSNFLPVPFLQYSSIPGIPDFLRQQLLSFPRIIFWLCESCNFFWLTLQCSTVPTGIRTTQIARIGFAILGFQNSFRSLGFVSCLPTAALLLRLGNTHPILYPTNNFAQKCRTLITISITLTE